MCLALFVFLAVAQGASPSACAQASWQRAEAEAQVEAESKGVVQDSTVLGQEKPVFDASTAPPAPVAVDQPLPYKYVGNNFSGKFHRPSCLFAKAMSARHACLFHFRKQAVGAGQVPCRWCLPPNWTTVRAKILPAEVNRKHNSETDASN